jgi:hypothetical protein
VRGCERGGGVRARARVALQGAQAAVPALGITSLEGLRIYEDDEILLEPSVNTART